MANPAADESFKNRRIVLVHGSSASSASMHTMAQALSKAGYTVEALDMRGHGDSGTRGHIGYIGQLEDDVADFMRALPYTGPNTLLGFSAGGGFALRFSASEQASLFDRYLLLSPFLVQAPTNRPNSGWASVGITRIVALTILNRFGIARWNNMPVTQFALDDEAKKFLTPSYSFALSTNFGAHRDYAQDIAKAPSNLKLIAGTDDELMFVDLYASLFTSASKTPPITLVPATNHIGLILNTSALTAIVAAAR
jgi:alpha-beta hydrolase superfamily lysophospholipase